MGHDLGMRSRVHPKYKTKYRVSNWAEYDRALVQRGDITLWISTDATDAWKPAPSGRRGGQRKFSDHTIETALMLRLVFKLPLRQAEGFLRSLLSLMGVDLEAPDHTTLSRRSQHLDVDFHLVPANEPIHLIVDSTGLSIIGDRLRARHSKAQEAETLIACNILKVEPFPTPVAAKNSMCGYLPHRPTRSWAGSRSTRAAAELRCDGMRRPSGL